MTFARRDFHAPAICSATEELTQERDHVYVQSVGRALADPTNSCVTCEFTRELMCFMAVEFFLIFNYFLTVEFDLINVHVSAIPSHILIKL